MKPTLYPPLAVIDDDLFQPPAAPQATPTPPATEPAIPSSEPIVMPAYLGTLIARQAASQQLDARQPPAVGQIRRLTEVPEGNGGSRPLGRSCGVLLGACLGGKRWHGWLVAQESDYACERDLVLQEEDGLLAPEAAMVQAWNPVEVTLTAEEGLLGRLTMERVAAVMRLTEYQPGEDDFVAPRPGRVGAWDLDGDMTVVTGTPLGDDTDPRHAYQRLYGRLAQELRAAPAAAAVPQAALAREAGLFAWLRRTFVTPSWVTAAVMVIVFQGVWLSGGLDLFGDAEPIYRSAAQVGADPCATRLRLVFQPDASYADVTVALRRAGAVLVDGPSETGEVWVLPPKDQAPDEAAAMLRQHHLVEQVDVMVPDARTCRK